MQLCRSAVPLERWHSNDRLELSSEAGRALACSATALINCYILHGNETVCHQVVKCPQQLVQALLRLNKLDPNRTVLGNILRLLIVKLLMPSETYICAQQRCPGYVVRYGSAYPDLDKWLLSSRRP